MCETEHRVTQVTALHAILAGGDGVLIGVQVDGQFWGWGECPALFDDPFVVTNMGTVAHTINKVIAPALKERPFTSLRMLCERLTGLTETVTTLNPEKTDNKPSATTRREMLAGLLKSDKVTDQISMREILEKRPLSPLLTFGIEQALIQAVAQACRHAPAQLLAADFGQKSVKKGVGLHVEVTDDHMAQVRTILKERVLSIGYHIQTNNPQGMLGEKGEKLESLVAQLTKWLSTQPVHPQLALYLNFNGVLTSLFNNNLMFILQLLHNIEQAAEPYPIYVENLTVPASDKKHTSLYRRLHSFLVNEENPVKLVVGFPHYSWEAINEFVTRGKVDGVYLDVTKIGHIAQMMDLIAACREKQIRVMVSGGERMRGVETAVAVAAAAGADLIAGPPALVYNTLQQLHYQSSQSQLICK